MVPGWILTLQALLTPTVAIAVCAIAFLQWRTANDKVLLDLFERRLTILREVDHALFDLLGDSSEGAFFTAVDRVERAALQAEFLFGDEIATFIRSVRERLVEVHKLEKKLQAKEGLDPQSAHDLFERRMHGYSHLEDDRNELSRLCRPYMKLDHRRVRTFGQWFSDRNELRKSYGD